MDQMETESLLKQTEIYDTSEMADLTEECYAHKTAEEKISELEKGDVHLDMKMLEKLENMPKEEKENQWNNRCIYRVPSHMRELNPEIYTPKLVSFGPYHYGASHLMDMEKHKYRALANVLERTSKSVKDYMELLKPVAEELMESYSDLDEKWKSNKEKFLQLMLLDGIFWLQMEEVYIEKTPSVDLGYSNNDPVFNSEAAGPFGYIDFSNDMKLLENQLPELLLTKLCTFVRPSSLNPAAREKTTEESQGTESERTEVIGLHFLDRSRKEIIGNHREAPHDQEPNKTFYTASTLSKAAITFKEMESAKSALDIKFDKNTGTLSIPRMQVFSWSTDIELLNMVAYELQRPGEGHEISSYILFITRLAATAEDVKLLRSAGIIFSDIWSEEGIAELLQKLYKMMRYGPKTSYDELRSELRTYTRRSMKKWNRRFRSWRLNLKETYFQNPWSFISLLAAIFLLVLTVLGTVYTALSYYKPGKN